MTNIFFDLEFTGLVQKTSLISIALVAEDGRSLYIESNLYDRSLVDDWIAENVIDNLFLLNQKHFEDCSVEFGFLRQEANYSKRTAEMFEETSNIASSSPIIAYTEDNNTIKDEIVSWLSEYKQVEFIGDCPSYDWVLFCELFGGALNLPEYISSSCHDINQDIANYLQISDRQAFEEVNREEFVGNNILIANDFAIQTGLENFKHNALWDASIVKRCYEKISK